MQYYSAAFHRYGEVNWLHVFLNRHFISYFFTQFSTVRWHIKVIPMGFISCFFPFHLKHHKLWCYHSLSQVNKSLCDLLFITQVKILKIQSEKLRKFLNLTKFGQPEATSTCTVRRCWFVTFPTGPQDHWMLDITTHFQSHHFHSKTFT